MKRLSKLGIWLHNLKQVQEDQKLIRCKECGLLQNKANWHYLKCRSCQNYLWDDRDVY
jgi:hypothetical protein